MLCSERGISLVYQGKQGLPDSWVLTVESYIKWYDIYAVTASGYVRKMPAGFSRKFEAETGINAWLDHVPRPQFCEWLTTLVPSEGVLVWDQASLDMIRARWGEKD